MRFIQFYNYYTDWLISQVINRLTEPNSFHNYLNKPVKVNYFALIANYFVSTDYHSNICAVFLFADIYIYIYIYISISY